MMYTDEMVEKRAEKADMVKLYYNNLPFRITLSTHGDTRVLIASGLT